MSEERPDAEIVAQKWDGTFKSQVEAPIPRFSWSHPTVNTFVQENYFRAASVTKVLAELLGDSKVSRGLEIGGGLGQQAINCYKMLGAERFDVLDLSSYAVEHGNKSARENGLNINYAVADLNNDTLPAATYDLIIANGSMHHIKNLEHIFEQINRALRPGGALFINEYVGPNYVQWTEKQLGIMNQLAAVLPDRLNRVRERNDAVVREITRIPLDIFAKHDPSESVRSSEILPMMHRYMDVVEVRPLADAALRPAGGGCVPGNCAGWHGVAGRARGVPDARQAHKMLGRPDMIHQFAAHLEAVWRGAGWGDVAVTADVVKSLNGRPMQRYIDPEADLTAESFRRFGSDPWVVPLEVPAWGIA